MQEKLLHFLWQYQYFTPDSLRGTKGESILVQHAGHYNENAGPDFLDATIFIDHIEWKGDVELHVKASDWRLHKHERDPVYNSVILHVVWENDETAWRIDNSPIPAVALQDKIPYSVIRRYQDLSENLWHIPCSGMIKELPERIIVETYRDALKQRIREKALQVNKRLAQNKGDWEGTTYQWLLHYFGFGKNAEPLERLGYTLPYQLIQRHRDHPLQVEALLFGAAGFLNHPPADAHQRILTDEFSFLKLKYNIVPIQAHEWKFMRMRPANFPTVRIAQLVSLLTQRFSLFSMLMDCRSLQDVYDAFSIRISEYWQRHYRFGKRGHTASPGKSAVHLLVINVIAPIKAAYRLSRGQSRWFESASAMLEMLPAEKNKYTRLWEEAGIHCHSASDSQGVLAQYRYYCQGKRCLDCGMGRELLKSGG